jgi:hypothetical protein
MALLKYGAGVPFYRQARLQALAGVPLPESVQYARCAEVARIARPVYELMKREAARAPLLHTDDTGVVILDLVKENRRLARTARRGRQTSGLVARCGAHQVALYASGRRHAGEKAGELLRLRPPSLGPPIQMADAVACNWSHQFQTIVAKCLAHARRQFVEIEAAFPHECGRVLDDLGRVYGYEAATRGMSDEERLEYHQRLSGPVMESLREWLDTQCAARQVEPNSSLGRALSYLRTHWEGLPQFLRTPGAALDNNAVARALKRAVLLRTSSLFYKTVRGACVGAVLMSLIETCALNGVNAWAYLVALIREARAVARDPARWLPWRFAQEQRSAA